MPRKRNHVTLSFPVYRDLVSAIARTGQIGAGMDPDALPDVPIFVQKGRGMYAQEGGFFTTLAKLIMKGVRAILPHAAKAVRKAAPALKAAAKQAAKEAAKDAVSTGAAALTKRLDGQGMALAGHGMMLAGSGMRLAGSGHCCGSNLTGTGMRLAGH